MMRKIVGRIGADAQNLKWIQQHVFGAFKMLNTPGVGSGNVLASYYGDYSVDFDSSRVVPAGAVNKPRAWGALACVYLGAPK